MCVYVYMHVCICIHVCMHAYVRLYVHVYVFLSKDFCIFLLVCVFLSFLEMALDAGHLFRSILLAALKVDIYVVWMWGVS